MSLPAEYFLGDGVVSPVECTVSQNDDSETVAFLVEHARNFINLGFRRTSIAKTVLNTDVHPVWPGLTDEQSRSVVEYWNGYVDSDTPLEISAKQYLDDTPKDTDNVDVRIFSPVLSLDEKWAIIRDKAQHQLTRSRGAK